MTGSKLKARYGPWAVVTGASSGIGAEFARQLAHARFNLVITARRIDKLEALARELEATCGIKVRCLGIDLSKPHGSTELTDATSDLEVGLLVSNAGHVVPGAFLGRKVEDYEGVLQLNVATPLALAHHFGREMAARGRGGILFTSSIGGFGPVPWMANYSGTKAYLLAFGAALRHELAQHGVDVAVLAPGPTDTPMATTTSAIESTTIPMMKVGPVVAEALRRLPRTSVILPGLRHKLLIFIMVRIFPRRLFTWTWGKSLQRTMDPRALDPNLPSRGKPT